ncbi:MAG: hypothetical protein M1831_005026 [Alyxoria varia]|nr:MAG: hypothetical protein M1831_005026 [Alyxoria varia]
MAADRHDLWHQPFTFGDGSDRQPSYGPEGSTSNFNHRSPPPNFSNIRAGRLSPVAPDFIPFANRSAPLSVEASTFYPGAFHQNNYSYGGFDSEPLTLPPLAPPLNPNAQAFNPSASQCTSIEGTSSTTSFNPTPSPFDHSFHSHNVEPSSTQIDDTDGHQQSFGVRQLGDINPLPNTVSTSYSSNQHLQQFDETERYENGVDYFNNTDVKPHAYLNHFSKGSSSDSNTSFHCTSPSQYCDSYLGPNGYDQANGNIYSYGRPNSQGNTGFNHGMSAAFNPNINLAAGSIPSFSSSLNGNTCSVAPNLINGALPPQGLFCGDTAVAPTGTGRKAETHFPQPATGNNETSRGTKRVSEDSSDDEYVPTSNRRGKTSARKKPGPKPGAKAKRQAVQEAKGTRQSTPRAAKKHKTAAQLETPTPSPVSIQGSYGFSQQLPLSLDDHEVCANCQWADFTSGDKPMAPCTSQRHVGRGDIWIHIECAKKDGTMTDSGPLCLGCVRLQCKPHATADWSRMGTLATGPNQADLPSPASTFSNASNYGSVSKARNRRKASRTIKKERKPSPLQGKTKSLPWSMDERLAAIDEMLHVLQERKHKRVDEVWSLCSKKMWEKHRVFRTDSAVKNEWNRRIRQMCGIDERAKPRPDCLVTGALFKKSSKKIQQYKKARALKHDAGTTEKDADQLCQDFSNFQAEESGNEGNHDSEHYGMGADIAPVFQSHQAFS